MPEETYVGKIGAKAEVLNEEGEVTSPAVVEASYNAQYDFGDDLAGLVAKFNENIVYKFAKAQLTTTLLRIIRNAGSVEGSTQESIQAAVDTWDPSIVTRSKKDPVATAMSAVGGMSPDQRAAFIAALEADQG